jgi:5-methylcytosine-specific restriction endonuclease McrA
MTYKIRLNRYPDCWLKVRRAIYRVTAGHCERCGRYVSQRRYTIHHIGAPYADGRPGNPADKHDIRRENLAMLCEQCHCEIEPFRAVMNKVEKKRKSKRKLHAALGIGTGLVVVQ